MVKKGNISTGIIKILIVLLLVLFGYTQKDEINNLNNFDPENDIETKKIQLGLNENMGSELILKFCPIDNCHKTFYDAISLAKSEIKCALHEFDNENLSNLLVEKSNQEISVEIIIDGKYVDEIGLKPIFNSNVSLLTDGERSKLMHHKFCVIDNEIVLTGSTNPTENGFFYNNNNMLVINSKYLASNFENEFDEMSQNKFGPQKKSTLEFNEINLNYQNNTYKVSSYFCPQDDCENELINILKKAEKEILFANFVLTLDSVENLLIEKSNSAINVSGIIEKRMFNIKGSNIEKLQENFKISEDTNSKTMHHKFFIIDNKYIVTGSMNPSSSGTKYNDEHMLVIENEDLATKFRDEFIKLDS